MKKHLPVYIIIIMVFTILGWFIIQEGNQLRPSSTKTETTVAETTGENLSQIQLSLQGFSENLHHSLALLFLQIIIILLISRLFRLVFIRISQPTVIGEIVAGIMLGPSLLGWIWPDAYLFLFPKDSTNLQLLSQIGLILFMFVIGMELDGKALKNKASDAIVISHASIIFPFFLGIVLSYFIYEEFAPEGISFLPFCLFMGIAMSITAFPVLARIVQERGLTKTPLGTMVLTCAAADDVTAWCILAVVIAIVKAGAITPALFTILFSIIYVVLMLFVVRPLMARVGKVYNQKETINKPVVGLIFLVLLASAWTAEVIGIHALFGAFLAGVIMPEKMNFKKVITDKVEDVSVILLLPLFFVATGLRTKIGLLNDGYLWLVCGAIVAVAVIGKLGGSAIIARILGQNWRNSLSIGVLMNTRGLMELVVLNIGYDLGVLSEEVFAMMVIMALVTTFMTGPCLQLIQWLLPEKKEKEKTEAGKRNVMISFGNPAMGGKLVQVLHLFTGNNTRGLNITALHITPRSDLSPSEAIIFERESFQTLKSEARMLGFPVETIFRATEEVSEEIIDTSHLLNPSLLIMGSARSMFQENIMGGRIRKVLSEVDADVFIYKHRTDSNILKILVLKYFPEDEILEEYAELIQMRSGLEIQTGGPILSDMIGKEAAERYKYSAEYLSGFQLVITTTDAWRTIVATREEWVEEAPNILLIKTSQQPGKNFAAFSRSVQDNPHPV